MMLSTLRPYHQRRRSEHGMACQTRSCCCYLVSRADSREKGTLSLSLIGLYICTYIRRVSGGSIPCSPVFDKMKASRPSRSV